MTSTLLGNLIYDSISLNSPQNAKCLRHSFREKFMFNNFPTFVLLVR